MRFSWPLLLLFISFQVSAKDTCRSTTVLLTELKHPLAALLYHSIDENNVVQDKNGHCVKLKKFSDFKEISKHGSKGSLQHVLVRFQLRQEDGKWAIEHTSTFTTMGGPKLALMKNLPRIPSTLSVDTSKDEEVVSWAISELYKIGLN